MGERRLGKPMAANYQVLQNVTDLEKHPRPRQL